MKKVFIIALFLVGCGSVSRACTGFTGNLSYKCSHQGVEYVQSDSGLALSVGSDGHPVGCK